MSSDDLLAQAIRVLTTNWHGHATVPSHGLYPHQWSWDSAFIVLGLQHWSPNRAVSELLSLFGAQWADGRIPHIAFNPTVADEAYFPGPSFWRSSSQPGSPPIATSGIIQPPVHAVAAASLAVRLGEGGTEFARRVYPHLVAQNRYIRSRRTISGLGLAAVVHPWESGMDNSPSWDSPLAAVPLDLTLLDSYTRRDLQHAGDGERPTDEDYARYIRLALAYRDHGYDDDWVRESGEFVVVDPAFNALWAWSELALAQLADRLGYDSEGHRVEAARITTALQERLLGSESDIFFALDHRAREMLIERTVGGLVPLILPGLNGDVVSGLVRTLRNPAFAATPDLIRGVPSYDRTADRYDPRRYWRGPTWLNTTWLIATGLREHGFAAAADQLDDDALRLVGDQGFREYFNPETGAGHGTDNFSWSAALTVHLLAQRLRP